MLSTRHVAGYVPGAELENSRCRRCARAPRGPSAPYAAPGARRGRASLHAAIVPRSCAAPAHAPPHRQARLWWPGGRRCSQDEPSDCAPSTARRLLRMAWAGAGPRAYLVRSMSQHVVGACACSLRVRWRCLGQRRSHRRSWRDVAGRQEVISKSMLATLCAPVLSGPKVM